MKIRLLGMLLILFLGFGCAEEEDDDAAGNSSNSAATEELVCYVDSEDGDYCMDYTDITDITEDDVAELCSSAEGTTATSCPEEDDESNAAVGVCEEMTPPNESGFAGTYDLVSYSDAAEAESDCSDDGGTWTAASGDDDDDDDDGGDTLTAPACLLAGVLCTDYTNAGLDQNTINTACSTAGGTTAASCPTTSTGQSYGVCTEDAGGGNSVAYRFYIYNDEPTVSDFCENTVGGTWVAD